MTGWLANSVDNQLRKFLNMMGNSKGSIAHEFDLLQVK